MKNMILTALFTCALVDNGLAAIVVEAFEEKGNVVFEGAGTINTTDLIKLPGGGTGAAAGINPQFGLRFQPEPLLELDIYVGDIVSLPDFGLGPQFRLADMSSGGIFGIIDRDGELGESIHLQQDYVSGSPLQGSMSFSGETFQTLGLTPGVYVGSWGSAANADTFTLRIIPESSSLLLAVFLAVLIVPIRRER